MTKLTLEHSEAVSTAKAQMIHLLDRDAAPRWRQHIEKQIALLSDVYWWVLHEIYNPGLPYDEKPTNGDFDLKDKPQGNGTVAKEG